MFVFCVRLVTSLLLNQGGKLRGISLYKGYCNCKVIVKVKHFNLKTKHCSLET